MYRILIVDDEPYVAEGLRVSLSEELDAELFELEAAFSAREALDRCRRRTFDIVVSDIRMPEMDGMSLQTCLREEFPACRVIFLTGHGDFALIRQAFRNHGTDYILKTEGDDQVLAAIYQTCTGLEAERAEQRQRLQEEVLLNRARAVIGQTLIAQIVSGDLTSAAGALEALGPDSLLPRKEGEFLVSVLRSDLPSASPDEAGYLELPIRLVEDSLEGRVRMIGARTGDDFAVLLIQTLAPDITLANRIRGVLETVQEHLFGEGYSLFSFALAAQPVSFAGLATEIKRLRAALAEYAGLGGLAIGGECKTVATTNVGTRSSQLIHRVDLHIAEHLAQDVSLSTLAGVVGLNPAYLSRLYVQETGRNLSERIADLRYERALRLLTTEDLKIADVARNVGFWTPSHFIRFFKKRSGMTPQAYRGTLVLTDQTPS